MFARIFHDYAKSIGITNYKSIIKKSFDSFVIKYINNNNRSSQQ